MWTKQHRKTYKRSDERYPSDLTDAEWSHLEPLIPPAKSGGRPRGTDMRKAMNAILYILRTGCPWRYLPRGGFPPRSTVYNIFRNFKRDGVWDAIWDSLHMDLRENLGREDQPDRRRDRQPNREVGRKGGGHDGGVGYDAGKKVKGRKIHRARRHRGPADARRHPLGRDAGPGWRGSRARQNSQPLPLAATWPTLATMPIRSILPSPKSPCCGSRSSSGATT